VYSQNKKGDTRTEGTSNSVLFSHSSQYISLSPSLRKAFPLSFIGSKAKSSSRSFSTVCRLTVSPQTPPGSKRLFTHMEYVQFATLHISSVHLHQTESRR